VELDPGLVGALIHGHQTKIEWRDTTNYAAAISDNNACYFDDTSQAGIVAHPMFPVAVTWPIVSRLDKYLDSSEFPTEVLMTQVHYSEHLILHRLIRPDDSLSLTGCLAALLPHRAGTHAIVRLDAVDAKGGPVFTEYLGALLRGVQCGLGGGTQAVPDPPEFEASGRPLWNSDIFIDPERPYIYDACTNIVFAIHTSPSFAQMVGLPGIILQGTATLAYAVREVVNRQAGGNPAWIKEIGCRFSGMVRPGGDIKVCCLGTQEHQDCTQVFFEVLNPEGGKAIRKGHIKIAKE
jgi:hypothetical protein